MNLVMPQKLVVVGGGDIGMPFSVNAAVHGCTVVICELPEGLEASQGKLDKVFRRAFKTNRVTDEAEQAGIRNRLSYSTDLVTVLKEGGYNLVVEAIPENLEGKRALHMTIRDHIKDSVPVVTTTSAISIDEIGADAGFHPMNPPHTNRGMEVVSVDSTSFELELMLWHFADYLGLVPFRVAAGKPGYAANGVFIPMCLEACHMADEGFSLATIEQAGKQATTFDNMGPFGLINFVKVQVAGDAAAVMVGDTIGGCCRASEALSKQLKSGEPFTIEGEPDTDKVQELVDRFRGLIFYHCCRVVEDVDGGWDALNRMMKVCFAWAKGPIEMMTETGHDKVVELIDAYREKVGTTPDVEVPEDFEEAFKSLFFTVFHDVERMIAEVCINRPDEKVFVWSSGALEQLDEIREELETDGYCFAILTGTGRLFAGGADVKEMAAMDPESDEGKKYLELGRRVFDGIEQSSMLWIAAVNSTALGGGFESALACHYVIAAASARFGFPEPTLGIFPGWDGIPRAMRRSPGHGRKVLFSPTKQFTAADIVGYGLAEEVVDGAELIHHAWEYVSTLVKRCAPLAIQELKSAVVSVTNRMLSLGGHGADELAAAELRLMKTSDVAKVLKAVGEHGIKGLATIKFTGE